MYLCFKPKFTGVEAELNKLPCVSHPRDFFTVESITCNGNDLVPSRGHASIYSRNIITNWLIRSM